MKTSYERPYGDPSERPEECPYEHPDERPYEDPYEHPDERHHECRYEFPHKSTTWIAFLDRPYGLLG